MNLKAIFQNYGAAIAVDTFSISRQEAQALLTAVEPPANSGWNDPNLDREQVHAIRQNMDQADDGLKSVMAQAGRSYQDNGAVVLSFEDMPKAQTFDDLKRQLVGVLSSFGMPFGAFKQKGFWQTLGVNPDAAPLRAASTGYIPLHIDFDQASAPPDGVALFCLRPDPLGGGDSIVFDYQKFLGLLSDDDRQFLSNFEYSYSTLYEQNGIGDVYNPHPLLDRFNGNDFLRYNGKVLPELSGEKSAFFEQLEKCFRAASRVLPLRQGDLIVVDQNKVLHGREALTPRGTEDVFLANQDRFLLQTYLRHGL